MGDCYRLELGAQNNKCRNSILSIFGDRRIQSKARSRMTGMTFLKEVFCNENVLLTHKSE